MHMFHIHPVCAFGMALECDGGSGMRLCIIATSARVFAFADRTALSLLRLDCLSKTQSRHDDCETLSSVRVSQSAAHVCMYLCRQMRGDGGSAVSLNRNGQAGDRKRHSTSALHATAAALVSASCRYDSCSTCSEPEPPHPRSVPLSSSSCIVKVN